MEIFSTIWNEALIRPLYNAVVWLYTALPWRDAGLAIIVLTAVVRLGLWPLFWKAQKSQREMALLHPEIKRIQERYKNNREEQTRALMELYRNRRVNPFSGCVFAILQAPALIALYWVFLHIFDEGRLTSAYLYSFIEAPEVFNPIAFGFLDLSKPNIYFGIIAAAIQYAQLKLAASPPPAPTTDTAKGDFSHIMQRQMTFILPLLILYLAYVFPSAPILYWTVFNCIAMLQDTIMKRQWTMNTSKMKS